jgi:hypothetical protein
MEASPIARSEEDQYSKEEGLRSSRSGHCSVYQHLALG